MSDNEAVKWIEEMRDHCRREVGDSPDLAEASYRAITALCRQEASRELLKFCQELLPIAESILENGCECDRDGGKCACGYDAARRTCDRAKAAIAKYEAAQQERGR